MSRATDCTDTSHEHAAGYAAHGVRGRLWTFVELILVWQDRARGRHALQQLDDRMLRDIGVTRADVERQRAKPFWR
jgi:uncharacterized protein YjiS (DUF1127 family)